MSFVFGLRRARRSTREILVLVYRLSKMAQLSAVPDSIDGAGTANLFIDHLFHQNGLPVVIGFARDPRFTSKF